MVHVYMAPLAMCNKCVGNRPGAVTPPRRGRGLARTSFVHMREGDLARGVAGLCNCSCYRLHGVACVRGGGGAWMAFVGHSRTPTCMRKPAASRTPVGATAVCCPSRTIVQSDRKEDEGCGAHAPVFACVPSFENMAFFHFMPSRACTIGTS